MRTPKKNVQRRHPSAFCSPTKQNGVWLVCKRFDNRNEVIGQGNTPRQAWANADWRIRTHKA